MHLRIKIRNIGVIAHVDAGKTTLSERLLETGGVIAKAGNVDDQSTMLDYLKMEKKRGITINAAAAQLMYKSYKINLIDLPGHVDFNIENEMSLLGIDGCICVVDSIAGVQVQTEKSFNQAKSKHIPILFFVNKMDKEGVNWTNTVESLKSIGVPILTQLPYFNSTLFPEKELIPSSFSNVTSLLASNHQLRESLIDDLCNYDESLIEKVLNEEEITYNDLLHSISTLTRQLKVNPVLFGSASKNIGIEELLQGIIDFLPPPNVKESCQATIFKIQHDKQRGFQYFTKVNGGCIVKESKLYNHRTNKSIQIQRLQRVMGNKVQEINKIDGGDIGIITGPKDIRIGDVLSSDSSRSDYYTLNIPEPMFFFSASPNSRKDAKAASEAIEMLQLIDPSISIETENDSWTLGCMGELHAEIIKDRLENIFLVNFNFGRMVIKQYFINDKNHTFHARYALKVGELDYTASFTVNALSINEEEHCTAINNLNNTIQIDTDLVYIKDFIKDKFIALLDKNDIKKSKFTISDFQFSSNYKENVGKYNDALTEAFKFYLNNSKQHFCSFEAKMKVVVECKPEHSGDILRDLVKRGGEIISSDSTIIALVFLRHLEGYSTVLRSLTHGHSSFSATFESFSKIN